MPRLPGFGSSGGGYFEKYASLGDLMLELVSRTRAQRAAEESLNRLGQFLQEKKTELGEKAQYFNQIIGTLANLTQVPMPSENYIKISEAGLSMAQSIFNEAALKKVNDSINEIISKAEAEREKIIKALEEQAQDKRTPEEVKSLINLAIQSINTLITGKTEVLRGYSRLGSMVGLDPKLFENAISTIENLGREASQILSQLGVSRSYIEAMKIQERAQKEAMIEQLKGQSKAEVDKTAKELYDKAVENYSKLYGALSDLTLAKSNNLDLASSLGLPVDITPKDLIRIAKEIDYKDGDIIYGGRRINILKYGSLDKIGNIIAAIINLKNSVNLLESYYSGNLDWAKRQLMPAHRNQKSDKGKDIKDINKAIDEKAKKLLFEELSKEGKSKSK